MNSSFFLVKWLFQAMDWAYRLLSANAKSGGIVVLTIFLFTLAIKLLTIFSDIKSRKSSIQMQAIQPDIERIKKKYANDPQRLNIEQRKLMKERGVSTFGGCLPMLIMMPLLFMFFAAFRAWSNQEALELMLQIKAGNGPQTFAGYRFLWITNIWRPDNLTAGGTMMNGAEFWSTFATTNDITDFIYYGKHEAELGKLLYDLHFFTLSENGSYVIAQDGGRAFVEAYTKFVEPITLNTELIGGAYEQMSNGGIMLFGLIPIPILPLLAGGTTFLSSWIMQRSQKKMNGTAAKKPDNGEKDKNDPAQQTQTMNWIMMIIMPLMSFFFCYRYDSTFAFYWIFSNVISLAITLILNATVFKKMQQQLQQDTVEVIKK